MAKTVEQRLLELEARTMATRAVLGVMASKTYVSADERRLDRDIICGWLEARFAEDINPLGHDLLQFAIAEVEQILSP